MAKLILNVLDFKAKKITRHKERCFIMVREAIYLKK